MRVVNPYTINPRDIRRGDVMMFVVKAMVLRDGVYRIYRCHYEGEDVPQGMRIPHEDQVADALFPSLARVAQPDPT